MNISSWLLRAFSALIVGGVAFFVALFFHNVDHVSSFSSLATAIIQKISEINSKIPIWYLIPPVFLIGEFLCSIGEGIVQHCVNAKENKSIVLRGSFEKTIENAMIKYDDFGAFILNKNGDKQHSEEAFNFSEMHFAFGYFWGGIGVLFLVSFFGLLFCFDIIGWVIILVISLILGSYIGNNISPFYMILILIAALLLSLFAILNAIDYRKFANLIIYLNSDNNKTQNRLRPPRALIAILKKILKKCK
jgi:hypothetical protein